MKLMYQEALAVLAASALLAGCGGASTTQDAEPQEQNYSERQLDASDNTDYVYLNLDTNTELSLTAEQAASSTDWHVAFRRFSVQLNGGASGPGAVVGAIADAQTDFYDAGGDPLISVFTNATPESELGAFEATLAAPGSWTTDSVVTQLRGTSSTDGGWYFYNPMNGVMSANTENGWLIRSGEGNSYARMRAQELTFATRSGNGVESFEFAFDVQVPGTDQLTGSATFSGSIPPAGGEVCFDFDADANVACSGPLWDLKIAFFGRDFYLRSNGGVSGAGAGAVFGPFEWDEISSWTSATIEPSGSSVVARYQEDVTSGIFDESSWYAYNLTGAHRLWPNYAVYLIDTNQADDAAPRYALQITGYYDATGASGYPRLRWRRVN
ncbi:MAG: HmuY family protein [Alcanivoracaceae bacterium]|nr:HmuY family protein [Alcanivoracaceae bacterium]